MQIETAEKQSVAVVVASRNGRVFRYSACTEAHQWTGTIEADAVETAILDVISRVREESDGERLRCLVQVSPRSTLWALRDEISVLLPGVSIERPTFADEHLVRAAYSRLPADRPRATGPVVVTACFGRQRV